MAETDSRNTELFRIFFSSVGMTCARNALLREVTQDGDRVSRLVTQIESVLSGTALLRTATIVVAYRSDEPELYALPLFAYLHSREPGLDDLHELDRALGTGVDLGRVLLQSVIGYEMVMAGHTRAAIESLKATQALALRAAGNPTLREFVQCLILRNLGLALERLGHFSEAGLCLSEGLGRCKAAGFALELSLNLQIANLYWASGQYELALATNQDPSPRARAEEVFSEHFLVRSHLNACKCAIDLKQTALARTELEVARRYLTRGGRRFAMQAAYATLYEGEIAVQEGRFEAGLVLIQGAQRAFETLDPPHHPGALDAKIAQVHFCLYEGDHRSALVFIRALLDEAERRQCLEARSRLLLLETYLFLTDDAAVGAGFENLLSRVHLINNPAVLLCALGNLFTHALEFLGETEQRFLLERIRNLQPVLDASCYEDLYQRYVTERFAYAMEKRLGKRGAFDIRDLLGNADGDGDSHAR